MEVVIQPDARAGSVLAARLVAKQIRNKPSSVLGLATGSTPLALYGELVRMFEEGRTEGHPLDFSHATSFNLDEYVGLGPEHPASYRYFMQKNLFGRVNFKLERTHVPDGLAADVEVSCGQYEDAIREAGGIDLQVLGIGGDGHIGFNEPTSSLASRTRIKTLTEETRSANRRFFSEGEEVPRHVITMGVGTIMEARCCILLAFGAGKAQAVADMVEGPISAMVPASILQMHPRAVVFIDDAAASRLKRASYYRFVFENKPSWQRY